MTKMTRKRSVAGLLALAAAMTLGAGRATAQLNHEGEVDLALTYTAMHANHTNGASFWLEGGALDVNAQFYRGLGLAASGAGMHAGAGGNSAALDLVTIVFGPSYTIHAGPRVSIFGEGLLGEAHGLHSLFSYGSGPLPSLTAGTTDSANALALQTGGGVNFRVSPRLSVRALEVDYLRTELPNGGTNVENSFRVAAGVVMTFGAKEAKDAKGHHAR